MVKQALSNAELLDTALRPARGGRRGRSPWREPGLIVPALVVLLLLVAICAPHALTGLDPDAIDPGTVLAPPDARHPFGTDELGRDLFSRVVHGTAQSLTIGIGAMLVASLGGIALGTAAALTSGAPGWLLQRAIEILLAFPEILLALLVIAVLGRGPANTLLAVGLSSVAGYARLVRSQVLRVRRSGYVEHAVALGEPPWTIVWRRMVPNTIRPLLVLATVGVGTAVLSASALSFLGLGVVPPAAEWGALLADGRNFFDVAPWTSLLPATVVAASVISITLLGRRLQMLLLRGETSWTG